MNNYKYYFKELKCILLNTNFFIKNVEIFNINNFYYNLLFY